MTSEDRIAQLEKIVATVQRKGRHSRVVFVFSILVVGIGSVVAHWSLLDRVQAATPASPGYVHDEILATKIVVVNEKGDRSVEIAADADGDGRVSTYSAAGKPLCQSSPWLLW